MTTMEQHSQALAKDAAALRLWKDKVNDKIKAMKEKERHGKISKFKRVSVKKKQSAKSTLEKPKDDFWLLSRYTRKFGDPRSAKNKKLGHRICKMHGYKGVVVPGDNEDLPWKIQNTNSLELENEKVIDLGSDADESIGDQAFEGLKDQQEAQYKEVACGVVASILAEAALKDGETREVKKHKKKRKRKDGKDSKLAGSRLAFALLGDDEVDEDDAASDDDTGHKRPKGKIITTPAPSTPPSPMEKTTSDHALSSGARLDKPITIDLEAGGKGRGRPTKDVREVAHGFWEDFQSNKQADLFFGEQKPVMKRLLARWIKVANDYLRKKRSDDMDMAKKKLTLIEQAMNVHADWKARKNIRHGIERFSAGLEVLLTVAQAPPTLI